MQEILNYLCSMLPYMLISLPFIITIRVVLFYWRRRSENKTNACHEIAFIFFALAVVAVLSQTVLVQLGTNNYVGGERINLVPFYTIYSILYRQNDFTYALINIAGNIAVFLPLGFLPPLLWRRFERVALSVGFCTLFSLLIEIVQYPLHRGTDVDDLILNSLGGLLGYLCYIIFKKLLPKATDKCKMYRVPI